MLNSLWSKITFPKLQTFRKRFKHLPSSTSKFFKKTIFSPLEKQTLSTGAIIVSLLTLAGFLFHKKLKIVLSSCTKNSLGVKVVMNKCTTWASINVLIIMMRPFHDRLLWLQICKILFIFLRHSS